MPHPRPHERGERASSSEHTVTAALRRHVGAFRRQHSPTPHQDRVLDWLCACQTPALGGRRVRCVSCDWSAVVYNSCRHRHCPQCRGAARAEWLKARQLQLLPVPHFQVVFTLPAQLRPIARDNPRVVYDLLLRLAAQTVHDLAADERDALPGIIAVLHTWASDLRFHPHVHLLVTAGGLRRDLDAWVATSSTSLLPSRQLAAIFRGKLAQALRKAFAQGQLRIRGPAEHAHVTFDAAVRTACKRKWVVDITAPAGRPADHVAKYLARYVYGTAIADVRVRHVDDTSVRIDTRQGPLVLPGAEFVRRFASHFLPKRFRRVRYSGLYAPGHQLTLWCHAWSLLGNPVRVEPPPPPPRSCPSCGQPLVDEPVADLRRCLPRSPPRARGPP